MRIKRIHAESMQDALERVRAELGPDAVIVSTRPLGATAEDRRRGLRGVEIVAGVDEQPVSAVAQARAVAAAAAPLPAVAPGAARAAYALSMGGAPAPAPGVRARKVEFVSSAAARTPEFPRVSRNGEPAEDDLDRMVPALEALAARGRAAQQAAAPASPPARSDDERQLLELIRLRHDEFTRIPPSTAQPAPSQPRMAAPTAASAELGGGHAPAALPGPTAIRSYVPPGPAAAPTVQAPERPAPRERRVGVAAHAAAESAFNALVGTGLSERLAERAIETAITRLSGADLGDTGRLLEIGLASLVAGIPALELSGRALAGRTLLFIGSAGAGKTAALLKVAVQLRREGADLGIIAADVSRIGAAEQLRRYGDVLRLPVAVTYTPDDVAAALAEAPAGRITLVDTPACTPSADGLSGEVAAIAGAVVDPLVVLTVAAGASDADLRRLTAVARAGGAGALAITKLDEAGGAAPVLNVMATLRLPALLLSTGRDVMGELERATAAEVAGAVLDELAELLAA